MNNLVVIIYDSIMNSVFEGQILTPLLNNLKKNPTLSIHLISFEKTPINCKTRNSILAHSTHLHLHIFKKTPLFLGSLSIILESRQLKKFLKTLTSYTLQARGPLAGALALSGLTPHCSQLLIQLRGLLAEEFLYTASHKKQTWCQKIITYLRYKQLHAFEKCVYQWQPPQNFTFILESVSPALQEYLQSNFTLHTNNLTIANNDIPPVVPNHQKQLWRTQIRALLPIQKDTTIFVYNGSCKPWQCFKETVEFFKRKYLEEPNSYLLVLSADSQECLGIIQYNNLPDISYLITHVPHHEIYAYLCASDIGLIFREKHIVNWSSRPTKALEYHAAGLTIIHNNTIAYLDHKNEKHII